ncbi:flagellar hook-associated protein FlgK [Aeromonas diversa CDC 2478-85]|uniref:Flagellar hook-associated protein 1 n=1 Tax=Aeromonas diversa CDC 2478-85 TaxID=1268237 RepID=N9V9J6_9GAMM|nr:flagellar hook-associated protein FlgK [Aeromonas diversa]ENY71957.1 flagellar hook-associated protein FlgK [Aeromonas diversa CDC 2478-85]
MPYDLLGIGTSGVLAHQKLLQTTSNNVVNVNSQGYVRERTLLSTNALGYGVGDSITERVINQYVLGEYRRDTSALGYANARFDQLNYTDNLLSDKSNSVGVTIMSYFNSIHSANESPSELAARTRVLTEMDTMVSRYNNLSTRLDKQSGAINNRIDDAAVRLNGLISSVHELNQAIIKTRGTQEENLMLNDQRDEAIRQLSEMVDIRTVDLGNGALAVNLVNGQSLVLAGSHANISVVSGDPETQMTRLQWSLGSNSNYLDTRIMGGSVGGLFQARADLEPTKRELGQLAVAMADAMNQQNHRGLDLDNQIGGDLFSLPQSDGVAYKTNTGSAEGKVSFVPGKGGEVTPYDYEVRFSSATNYEVFAIDEEGNETSAFTGSGVPGVAAIPGHGIELSLTGVPVAGDKILFQPTKQAAGALEKLINRAEDLALASPLKADRSAQNLGNGKISLTGIYNTGTGSGFGTNTLSATAPQVIKINGTGDYEVYQADGATLIGTAPAATKGENILANLENPPGTKVYPDPTQAPGYEFSIIGTVKDKDSFKLSYNTDGFADNTNGVRLANLQTQDLVRKETSTSSDDKMTLSEAYTAIVVDVGNKTSTAKTYVQAATGKLEQTFALHESASGVNLEEEAANLVRFQQAYAASAQVVSTAKTIFDTLLSSVR